LSRDNLLGQCQDSVDTNIFVVISREVAESITRGINSVAESIFYLDSAIVLHPMHNDKKIKQIFSICTISVLPLLGFY
jgi:hypothetical protein